jgi:hypothetical protein
MLDWFSGFDHFATADMTLGVTGRFTTVSGMTIAAAAARTGSNGLRGTGAGQNAVKTGLSNAATRVLGFAAKFASVTGDPGRVFAAFGDGDPSAGATVQVGLALSASGAIQVFRGRQLSVNSGGTQLGSDSANTLSSATSYFIELVVTFNGSTGTVEVFVNGSKTGWIDLTGQDTTNTVNNYANAFGFGGRNGGNSDFDDAYVVSGSGGVRTARLGDVKAVSVLPSTGDGALGQFTPSTGSDNGAMVDDAAPNGNTDYNESTSVANIDTYAFPALGAVGVIHGLNLHNYTQKTDAGVCDGQGVVRIGSTNYLQTQRAMSTTYGYSTDLLEQSPASAADFTPSEVNGAEFGLKHSA